MAATLEDKQFQELNKSVKMIVKTLENAIGNTATQKAKKSEEELLADLRMKNVKKEEELLKKQDKQEETNRVKLFDVATFMKESATQYFDATKEDKITWGKFLSSLHTGVKDWFNAASKQRTMLGATLRLGATLWENTHKHLIQNFQRAWSKVTSVVNEVLGELGEVFGFIKDTMMSVFGFIKDSFMGFFKRVPPHDRRRNKLLQALVGFARRREKRDMIPGAKDKGIDWGIIGGLALVAAGVLGAFLGKLLLPFQAIAKALKLGPIFKAIKTFLMSFPKLAGFFKALAKPFAAISKIFLAAQTNLPFFAKLVTAFKWGFAKLAWPIQLVLSIFDFIEGWAATEGNIAEKFMGGLMNAFEKFMDLPVRLIGWIVEKVAGLFGAEVDGVAEKIMGFLKGIIEFGTAWMKPLITFFETFFTTEGTLVEKLKTSIGAFFEAWQSWIDKIIDKFAPLLKWLGIKIGTPEAATTTPATTAPETSTLDRTTTAQAKKTAAENQTQTDEVVNAINDNTKKQMDQSKKLADEQGDITAMAIGGKGGDAGPADTADKQLPDDSEIYAFLAGNNNF